VLFVGFLAELLDLEMPNLGSEVLVARVGASGLVVWPVRKR